MKEQCTCSRRHEQGNGKFVFQNICLELFRYSTLSAKLVLRNCSQISKKKQQVLMEWISTVTTGSVSSSFAPVWSCSLEAECRLVTPVKTERYRPGPHSYTEPTNGNTSWIVGFIAKTSCDGFDFLHCFHTMALHLLRRRVLNLSFFCPRAEVGESEQTVNLSSSG